MITEARVQLCLLLPTSLLRHQHRSDRQLPKLLSRSVFHLHPSLLFFAAFLISCALILLPLSTWAIQPPPAYPPHLRVTRSGSITSVDTSNHLTELTVRLPATSFLLPFRPLSAGAAICR